MAISASGDKKFTWDKEDDWATFNNISGASVFTATRLASPPQPYRRGCGKLVTTTSSGTWYIGWDVDTAKPRSFQWSFAIRPKVGDFASALQGPFLVKCEQSDNTSLGTPISTQVTTDQSLAIRNPLADDYGSIPNFWAFPNNWLIVEMRGSSVGDVAGAYTVNADMRVGLDLGSRVVPLGHLHWGPTGYEDIHHFQAFRYGFAFFLGASNNFEVYLDDVFFPGEARGSGVPALVVPPPRRSSWPTFIRS